MLHIQFEQQRAGPDQGRESFNIDQPAAQSNPVRDNSHSLHTLLTPPHVLYSPCQPSTQTHATLGNILNNTEIQESFPVFQSIHKQYILEISTIQICACNLQNLFTSFITAENKSTGIWNRNFRNENLLLFFQLLQHCIKILQHYIRGECIHYTLCSKVVL